MAASVSAKILSRSDSVSISSSISSKKSPKTSITVTVSLVPLAVLIYLWTNASMRLKSPCFMVRNEGADDEAATDGGVDAGDDVVLAVEVGFAVGGGVDEVPVVDGGGEGDGTLAVGAEVEGNGVLEVDGSDAGGDVLADEAVAEEVHAALAVGDGGGDDELAVDGGVGEVVEGSVDGDAVVAAGAAGAGAGADDATNRYFFIVVCVGEVLAVDVGGEVEGIVGALGGVEVLVVGGGGEGDGDGVDDIDEAAGGGENVLTDEGVRFVLAGGSGAEVVLDLRVHGTLVRGARVVLVVILLGFGGAAPAGHQRRGTLGGYAPAGHHRSMPLHAAMRSGHAGAGMRVLHVPTRTGGGDKGS